MATSHLVRVCVCVIVAHVGGLSRCRLVGSCVLPGEDFFTQSGRSVKLRTPSCHGKRVRCGGRDRTRRIAIAIDFGRKLVEVDVEAIHSSRGL